MVVILNRIGVRAGMNHKLTTVSYAWSRNDMTENEKAFAFYAYNLSIISTGLSSQKATISARQSFGEASVVNTIQAKLSNEPEYGKMILKQYRN